MNFKPKKQKIKNLNKYYLKLKKKQKFLIKNYSMNRKNLKSQKLILWIILNLIKTNCNE